MFPARPLLAATLAVLLFTQAAVAADGPPPDLLARAEKGDVAAEADLGVKYLRADGIPRDIKKALSWLNKAANKGSAKAQSALGEIYRDGEKHNEEVTDVKPDPKLAEKWFRKAAAQDDPEALYFVSTLTNDPKEKIALLEKAANKDHIEAQTALGYLYAGVDYNSAVRNSSAGVEHDAQKAEYWLNKAAHFYKGAPLATDDIDSQYALARRYLTGDGVAQDYAKAAELFHLVVSHNAFVDSYSGGDYEGIAQDAYLQLGLLYKNGNGVEKSDREAARWFSRAARLGSLRGWYNLGQAYDKGEGVPQDALQAYLAYTRVVCNTFDCEFADVGGAFGVGLFSNRSEEESSIPLAKEALAKLVSKMSADELKEARRVEDEERKHSIQIFNQIFISTTHMKNP